MEPPVKQLWSFSPIIAPDWSADFAVDCKQKERFYADVQRKNMQLAEELAIRTLRLSVLSNALDEAQVLFCAFSLLLLCMGSLIPSQQARQDLALELEQLRRPCFQRDDSLDYRPLTVGKVISELRLTVSTQELHRLSLHVHHAYARVHGEPPVPRIYYDANGTPERICCYTEADRDLILSVLNEHVRELVGAATPLVEAPCYATVNPPC